MPSPDRPIIGLIEDDPVMGESLDHRLTLEGYQVLWWQTGAEALAGLKRTRPHVILCDIRLPDLNGEELFRRALPMLGGTPILFITAFGEIDQAVRLVRAGATDYLTKPFPMDRLLARLAELVQPRRLGADTARPLLGMSEAMQRIEGILRRAAMVDSTVLLTGESGVGKEVAARFLHDISPLRDEPFVPVNCAAIPTELMDSEFFGHEQGAFTGAQARHNGFAERAGRGVLFLDEISELPLGVQAKLLRLIQDRTFVRVGGEQTLRFQARLVCATNADLAQRVQEGSFRQDLYYRINVIGVHIPPLRDRREEIPALITHYVRHYAERFGMPVRALTTTAETAARDYDWPGNIRELRNRIERAMVLTEGPRINVGDLFPEWNLSPASATDVETLAQVRDDAERRHIAAILRQTDGQVGKAALLLGISRTTLWEKMRKLGLDQPAPET